MPPLLLMPATRELIGAQAWMRDYVAAGVEGVVVKHREHGYRPRRRSWKVRTRLTADAVVGGVIGPLQAPEALLLGLPDEQGRLRMAGRTGPLTLPARRDLGVLLRAAQRARPWPDQIPSSRFGQLPGDFVDYTPTEPLLVVEVDADVASSTTGGGTRPDSGACGSTCTLTRSPVAKPADGKAPWVKVAAAGRALGKDVNCRPLGVALHGASTTYTPMYPRKDPRKPTMPQ
jgi:hypothetical protein